MTTKANWKQKTWKSRKISFSFCEDRSHRSKKKNAGVFRKREKKRVWIYGFPGDCRFLIAKNGSFRFSHLNPRKTHRHTSGKFFLRCTPTFLSQMVSPCPLQMSVHPCLIRRMCDSNGFISVCQGDSFVFGVIGNTRSNNIYLRSFWRSRLLCLRISKCFIQLVRWGKRFGNIDGVGRIRVDYVIHDSNWILLIHT